MASMAEIAAQMAAQNIGAQQAQSQPNWQALTQDRVAPISYEDWQQGAFEGKELGGVGRSHYDNWANKYYNAGSGGRDALLQNHGLQFSNPDGGFGWGWQADSGIDALPGGYDWSNRRAGGQAGQLGGQGAPGYGMPQNMTAPGGYLSGDGWRGRLGGAINAGSARAEAAMAEATGYAGYGRDEPGNDTGIPGSY